VEARDLAAELWPGRQFELEPLGGGITNHNFKVVVDGEAFVLRIVGRDTDQLGIDRGVELEASRNAAALGIGPEVVGFVDGCLVTRFLEGETGQPRASDAGALLRRLHDGPPIPGRFDSFRVVETYAATAGGAPPPYERAKAIADRIETRRGDVELRACHNDLLPANFVHDGKRLRLVDWEYAGMGDPCFDLANYAVNNGLDEAGEAELLESYGGGEVEPAAVVLMRFMSDFREAMWGVVQQAISQLDFDFAGYAAEHFERLERTAAEPRFRRALDLD
jgi:thiamine kinase-like enzyme